MIIRHSPLVVFIAYLSLILPTFASSPDLLTIHDSRASSPNAASGSGSGDLICRPFGECEPCPPDELDQPFCQPFGNRRLLHCKKSDHSYTSGTHDTSVDIGGKGGIGEIPAWEACGRVIAVESRDFWEFVTCNLLFLIVALTILWARTSALASQQYRQLAARIGIPGGGWRT